MTEDKLISLYKLMQALKTWVVQPHRYFAQHYLLPALTLPRIFYDSKLFCRMMQSVEKLLTDFMSDCLCLSFLPALGVD